MAKQKIMKFKKQKVKKNIYDEINTKEDEYEEPLNIDDEEDNEDYIEQNWN